MAPEERIAALEAAVNDLFKIVVELCDERAQAKKTEHARAWADAVRITMQNVHGFGR